MDLSSLNSEQRQAVECLEGPLLVLAGAGSGKTRVLTYRIANLIEHGVKPWSILALTFTNKAAGEMRERTEALLSAEALPGLDTSDMWVTTFHSFCARVLRRDADKLGFERNFVIYDDADQNSVITEILKKLGAAEKELPKRMIRERISDAKNRSADPEAYLKEMGDMDGLMLNIYRQYQKKLMENNAMDFDDLLLKTVQLFSDCTDVLERYRAKFQYVLIDEYQDTNMTQYRLVELLCRAHKNLCVVGDDDQSIYGWRGADVSNILGFEKDFTDTTVIRLEQNYRSTGNILEAANGVIVNNLGRKPKKLWTEAGAGEKIELYAADSERDEASFICKKILEGTRKGGSYNDYAILYRMNAQSRVIEGTLANSGIPYRVYGGLRFYERKEIKDIMSYLRLIYNPNDDVAFLRVVNVPKRGLGEVTMRTLTEAAEQNGMSLLMTVMSGEGLAERVRMKLQPFADAMAEFIAASQFTPLSVFTENLIKSLEYEQYLAAEDKKNDLESRLQNLAELVGNIKEIERDVPEGESSLAAFLENVALVSDIDALQEGVGTVSLMTLHSAKGLEFDTVFLTGMEENVFPSARARNDMTQKAMEEERRLCYVGITRARRQLYLTNARMRMLFGDYSYNRPSRFLEEIPQELIVSPSRERQLEENRRNMERLEKQYPRRQRPVGGFGVKPPEEAQPGKAEEKNLKPFMKVRHAKFGAGTVLEVAGSGSSMTVSIDFGAVGVKKFAAAYAPITVEE